MIKDIDVPAFPAQFYDERATGMTLRDYFAAKAMLGIYSHFGGYSPGWAESDMDVAKSSYQIADAMLKVREVK